MKCDAFEAVITDLARSTRGEDPEHREALTHAESCVRCNARLAEEMALTAVFSEAAADTCKAPERVETALLAAYRERRSPGSGQGAGRTAALVWRIAATAVITVLSVTAYRALNGLRQQEIVLEGTSPEASAPAVPVPVDPGSAAGVATAAVADNPMAVAPGSSGPRVDTRSVPAPEIPAPAEIATDFMPLTSEGGIALMESGQLMRVRLPRSALAAVGLPVNPELADQPVTAQVLIGQDGIARAIRFLNEPNAGFAKTKMQSKQ